MAAIRAERVVVGAHRPGKARRDGLLAVAEMGRAPDETLEEELLGPLLERPALDHRPVHRQPGSACNLGVPAIGLVRVRDEQLVRREVGDHLRAVGGHDDFFLDPGRREAVSRRTVRLEGDHHPL